MELNNYLFSLADYIDQLEWSKESDESNEESKEWESGDEQVVHNLDKTIYNT